MSTGFYRRHFLTGLLALLLSAFGSQAGWAAGSRVAIIASPGAESAAALLTASLSASPGVAVMEREQLDKIAGEKALEMMEATPEEAAKMGRLLGADALIILDKTSGTMLSARLVAVGPGVIVDDQSIGWPLGDPEGWASFLARRFSASLANLPVEPKSKILLAVLAIRSPVVTNSSGYQEREATFSINRALARLPNVFTLDRTRLREADWEKQLANSSASFWASAWLFDGSISGEEGHIVLDGRLQSLAGGTAKIIRVEAPDASALGELVAREIAPQLQTPTAPAGPVAANEAAQFQAEAEWNFRWQQYEQAERAADASWYLGNRNEAVGLLRAKSPARLAKGLYDSSVANNYLSSGEPRPGALEDMNRALSNLRGAVKYAGAAPSPQFLGDAAEVLEQASELLQAYYYLPRERTPEEQDQLKWVRAEIRQYVQAMLEEGLKTLSRLKPYERKNLLGPPAKSSLAFFVLNGWYGPLWADTPEQSAQNFVAALKAADSLDPELVSSVRDQIVNNRMNHKPLVVAWNKADQASVPEIRQKLLQDLQTKGPRDRFDALVLNFEMRWFFSIEHLQKRVPIEEVQKPLVDFYLGLADLRKAIVSGTIPERELNEALNAAYNMRKVEAYKAAEPAVAAASKQFFMALLREKWVGDSGTGNLLLNDLTFTPQERDEILPLIAEAQKGRPRPSGFLSHYQERVISQTKEAGPAAEKKTEAVVETDAVGGPEPSVRYRIAPEDGESRVQGVLARNGSFYAQVFFTSAGGEEHLQILELNPSSGSPKTIVDISKEGLPTALADIPAWAVDDHHVYFGASGRLYRVSRENSQVELKALPVMSGSVAQIFAVGGKVYIGMQDGAIVRVDPDTFSADLLASARRHPGQTLLDDCTPYTVRAVFEENGAPIFIVSDGVYAWDEGAKNFRKLDRNLAVMPGIRYDRAFYLKRIETDRYQNIAYVMLLLDPGRTGQVPRMLGYWPPMNKALGLGDKTGQIYEVTASGQTLYLLLWAGLPTGYSLKVLNDTKNFIAPLRAANVGQGHPIYNKITAVEGGVLIWGEEAKEMLFYSLKDLEKSAP